MKLKGMSLKRPNQPPTKDENPNYAKARELLKQNKHLVFAKFYNNYKAVRTIKVVFKLPNNSDVDRLRNQLGFLAHHVTSTTNIAQMAGVIFHFSKKYEPVKDNPVVGKAAPKPKSSKPTMNLTALAALARTSMEEL